MGTSGGKKAGGMETQGQEEKRSKTYRNVYTPCKPVQTGGETSTRNELCPSWDIGLIGDSSEVGKMLRNIQGLYA